MHLTIIVINMKKINLRLLLVISFLTIIIPGKIFLINGIHLFFGLLSIFNVFFINTINTEEIIYMAMGLSATLGIILIFKKNKLINLTGIALQYSWLLYILKLNDFNNLASVITPLIYLILSLYVIYLLIIKKTNL